MVLSEEYDCYCSVNGPLVIIDIGNRTGTIKIENNKIVKSQNVPKNVLRICSDVMSNF